MRNHLLNTTNFHHSFGMSMMSYSNAEFNYSYGMNTQEKDDEIYGKGNSYSAEYWQYDARLGRRWNNDPRPNPSISVYACFGNNPIIFSDVRGDTIMIAEGSTPDFRQKTFEYLQSLTNDLLKMDKNGMVTIVPGKQGTMNTDKSLVKGTALIRKLNQKGGRNAKSVLIKEGDGSGSITQGNVTANKSNGIGTGSVIFFDINQKPTLMSDGTKRNDPNMVLGHELFHASHNWDGTNKGQFDISTSISASFPLASVNVGKSWYKIGVNWLREEELFTRHEENELRKEQGIVNRAILPPATQEYLIMLLSPAIEEFKNNPPVLEAIKKQFNHPQNKRIP